MTPKGTRLQISSCMGKLHSTFKIIAWFCVTYSAYHSYMLWALGQAFRIRNEQDICLLLRCCSQSTGMELFSCFFSQFIQLLLLCKVSHSTGGEWIKKSRRTNSTGCTPTGPSLIKCCGLAERLRSLRRKSFLFSGNQIYSAWPSTVGSGLPSSKTM